MDIKAIVAQGRSLAEQVLTDAVVLELRGPKPARDATGNLVYDWTKTYEGAGLVQVDGATSRSALIDSAGEPAAIVPYVIKLPYSVQMLPDRVYRVRVAASLDLGNIATYRITSFESNGWAILRRLHGVREHG